MQWLHGWNNRFTSEAVNILRLAQFDMFDPVSDKVSPFFIFPEMQLSHFCDFIKNGINRGIPDAVGTDLESKPVGTGYHRFQFVTLQAGYSLNRGYIIAICGIFLNHSIHKYFNRMKTYFIAESARIVTDRLTVFLKSLDMRFCMHFMHHRVQTF